MTRCAGKVPPPKQWIFIWEVCWQKILPPWAEFFAASKFCSNEVTTLCPTRFSYIKPSFPSLQSTEFLPPIQPHAAAIQKWNYDRMEEVGDFWEVFWWKKPNPIKKTSDGCVVKDIPKLSVLWLLLATTFGSHTTKTNPSSRLMVLAAKSWKASTTFSMGLPAQPSPTPWLAIPGLRGEGDLA